MNAGAKQTKNAHKDHRRQIPALEWIASGVGFVLFIALLGFIGWDAYMKSGRPPTIVVEAGQITEFERGFTLELRARNLSDAAAAHVEIEGALMRGQEVAETARTKIAYVPGASIRRAGLFFTKDPRKYDVRLRALGFAAP